MAAADERELPHAIRRTTLANERTELAWWRTGLTALAVALAVGRVIPDIQDAARSWPYTLAGVGFALYGAVLIAYGSLRGVAVERALRDASQRSRRTMLGLAAAGVALSLFVVALVLFD